MKTCNICNQEKSFNLFYSNKLNKDGYFKYCKLCHLQKSKLRQKLIIKNKNENLYFLENEFFSEHFDTGLLISNLGRVFKKEQKEGKNIFSHFLKQTIMNNGYVTVSFNSKHIYVHRLVAETFIYNTEEKPFVNHIDLNKTNNNLSNLEWCSNLENINHSIKNDRYSVKLNREQVKEIRQLITKYNVKELAYKYNVSKTNIRLIINKKIWKYL
jgi:hypothetical protein